VRLASVRGERTLDLEAFQVDAFQTALEPDELVVDVLVQPLPNEWRVGYVRFARFELPSFGIAVAVRTDAGTIRQARIAVGCVGAKPTRLARVEERLGGVALADVPTVLAEARHFFRSALEPADDLHGSADYKLHMTRILLGRAIERAATDGAGRGS
jgi:carbon-monoxide dehydrogenase medium subunit